MIIPIVISGEKSTLSLLVWILSDIPNLVLQLDQNKQTNKKKNKGMMQIFILVVEELFILYLK